MTSRLSARYLVLTLVAIHALWPALPCGSDTNDNAFAWACRWNEHQAQSLNLFDHALHLTERSSNQIVSTPSPVRGDNSKND